MRYLGQIIKWIPELTSSLIRIKNSILFSFFLLVVNFHLQAQTQFDPELLLDSKKNGPEVASKLKTKEVYEYSDTLKNCIYLKNGFRSARFVNEQEWLSISEKVEVFQIDVVYSKYPIKKGVYSEIYPLLFMRLQSLFLMDPNLNDDKISWNKILQTHCLNDEQVSKLFHGVVIHYRIPEKETEEISVELTKYDVVRQKIEEEERLFNEEQDAMDEVLESIDFVKSMPDLPDSIRKQLNNVSTAEQIKILERYLQEKIKNKKEINLKESSPEELKDYEAKITAFSQRFATKDTVIEAVFNRHPEWKNVLVVNDWTGSMYGYGSQVLKWHIKHIDKSGILSMTIFNDGDDKETGKKTVGETEGIYFEKADNVTSLIDLFNYVMMKGSGGDGPENDTEAILRAMEEYPYFSEIVLIADNNACIRDIELADRIGKPVKVIICGYDPERGINPDLVYLATKTGGGIYTIESDLENINAELGTKGEVSNLLDTRFKIMGKRCGNFGPLGESAEIHNYKYAKFHKKKIRKLDMSKSELEKIPDKVFRMYRLNYLDLSENKLKEIPDDIEALRYLKNLNLSKNKLNKLPAEFIRITYLQHLNLSDNQFDTIPPSMLKMKYLLSLNLASNRLEMLPKMNGLVKLQVLDLSKNQLKELPKSISQLKALREANFEGNQLTVLPKNITYLSKLRELNLSNNRLTELPANLENLKRMTLLNLSGNPINPQELERIRKALPDTKIIF